MEAKLLNITGRKFNGLLTAMFPIVIFLVLNIPVVSAQFLEAEVQRFEVHADAPDFTLKELGRGKVSLKEFRGKIILLNFFAPS